MPKVATATIEKNYDGCSILGLLHGSLTPASCMHKPKKTEIAVLQSLTMSFLQKPFKLILIFLFTVWYLKTLAKAVLQTKSPFSSAGWTNALASAGVTLWAFQYLALFYLGTLISKPFTLSRKANRLLNLLSTYNVQSLKEWVMPPHGQ